MPPRRVDHAQALVLGVYPSALHIRWTHPEQRIAALAVAQEPWPFWAGEGEAELVDRWRQQVGWRQEWGTAQPVGRLNGSSGRAVLDRVLLPLGLDPDRAWMTDALPFFHVHRGQGSQGDAMSTRYDIFARSHGLPVHQLPDRPSADELVRRAVAEEGARLVEEILDSDAPLVITLGNEALTVAASLLDGDVPARLTADGDYGRRYPASLRGRTLELLPLIHPGQRGAEWTRTHAAWIGRRTG